MKLGVKLHTTNYDLYDRVIEVVRSGLADYLELTYIPSQRKHLDKLEKSGIPIIVHSAHAGQGICFAGDEIESNKVILEQTIKAAGCLDAKYVIIHPDKGSMQNFLKVLSSVNDERLLVENMPKAAIKGGDCLGYSYEQLVEIMEKGFCGLCLDFGHAFKAANSLEIEFSNYCRELISLQPSMFHIAQGTNETPYDEHLDLDDGNIDLFYVKRIIDDFDAEAFATVEVPFRDGVDNTLENIQYFKELG